MVITTPIHLFGPLKFIDREDCVSYAAKRMGSGLRDILKVYEGMQLVSNLYFLE